MMSISPADGQFERSMVPDVPAPLDRKPAPSIQNAGRLPTPLEGLGCLTEAVTSISSQPKKVVIAAPFVHDRDRSRCRPGLGARQGAARRSAMASRKTAVWRSTSDSWVTGDISAMLWNGVISTPRFIACRWK